jgi:hypothetical protein
MAAVVGSMIPRFCLSFPGYRKAPCTLGFEGSVSKKHHKFLQAAELVMLDDQSMLGNETIKKFRSDKGCKKAAGKFTIGKIASWKQEKKLDNTSMYFRMIWKTTNRIKMRHGRPLSRWYLGTLRPNPKMDLILDVHRKSSMPMLTCGSVLCFKIR